MSVNKFNLSAVIVLVVALIFSCTAKENKNNSALSLGLSNYTIPLFNKGAVIGQIYYGSHRHNNNFQLIKDTSALFTINTEGYLALKDHIELTLEGNIFVFGITIGVNGINKEIELVKDDFLTNKIVAHRGAWKKNEVSENSLSSLRNAIELGCGWSEFDIWLSADGVPVLSHNSIIGGFEIEKTNIEELQKVELKNNDRVSTLEEYLKEIKNQNGTRLFLEIKPSDISDERGLALAQEAVQIVHHMKAQAWVNYISFDLNLLLKVNELDPFAKTAYLGNDKTVEELHDLGITGIDFNKSMFQNDDTLIPLAHEFGMSTNAWTVNNSLEMRFLLNLGIDYITTNEPELLKEILIEESSTPQK